MGKEINMNGEQQQKININPEDLEDVVCEKCESQCFEQTFLFKKLTAVLAPSGQDTMLPLQIFRCADCGHINEIFMPSDTKLNFE